MAYGLGVVYYILGVKTQGVSQATTQVNNFANGLRRSQGANDNFVKNMRNMESAAVLAMGPLSGVGARLRSLGMLMEGMSLGAVAFTAGIVATGYGLFKLGEAAVTANMQLSAMRARLQLLTESQALAERQFEFIIDVSNRAGFAIADVSDSYTRLMAASRGTLMEGEKIETLFEDMAMAAGNLRLTNEDFTGSLKALEQMMSKGRVQREELAQQLGDRFPAAFKIAATAMGKTTAELTKMLATGKVASDDFLPKFGQAVIDAYGIDKFKAVDSLQAAINRVHNSWLLFADSLDRAVGVSDAFKLSIEGITSGLETLAQDLPIIIGLFDSWGKSIVAVLTAIGVAIINEFRTSILGLGDALDAAGQRAAGSAANMDFFDKAVHNIAINMRGLQTKVDQLRFEDLTKRIKEYAASGDLLDRSLVQRTQNLIDETIKQIDVEQKGLDALKTSLDSRITVTEQYAQKFPKLAAIIQGAMDLALNVDPTGASNLQSRLEQNKAALEGYLSYLRGLQIDQEHSPIKKPISPDSGALGGSAAQTRRLEDTALVLEKLRAEVDAMYKGPGKLQAIQDFYEAKDATQSFRQSLEQTGQSQAEVNAKVAEFQELFKKKQDFHLIVDGIKEIQSVITSAFDSMADTIAKSMMEGKFAMEDFVDIGKKLIQELISKLIQLAIFNPILNSLLGTQQPIIGAPTNLAGVFNFAAKGDILTGPTLLKSRSKGSRATIAGEAGPEAVLPLARTSTGDLGVSTVGMGGGGSVAVGVQVNIHNHTDKQVETKRTDKGVDIVIMDRMTASVISRRGTVTDKALRTRNRTISRGA